MSVPSRDRSRPDRTVDCVCWCGRRYIRIDKSRVGVSTDSCGRDDCSPDLMQAIHDSPIVLVLSQLGHALPSDMVTPL